MLIDSYITALNCCSLTVSLTLPIFGPYATNFWIIDNLGMLVLTHSITHNVFVSVVSAKKKSAYRNKLHYNESGHKLFIPVSNMGKKLQLYSMPHM